MIVDYNPGMRHGQEIFKNKTRGIPEAERFEVVSKEANSLRKLLISKSTVLGGIITRVPLQETPDANGNVVHANLVEQHQFFSFQVLQR